MEEILASIRRIISEDEPAAAPEPFEVPPAPELAPAPAVARVEQEDVLELTEKVPEPITLSDAVETHGDLDVAPFVAAEVQASPAPEPEPVEAFAPTAPADMESLLSPPAAEAASTAFGQLSRTIQMPAEGRTLEDVVRELLRPLLKSWLDDNLPGIVQTAVNEEVERLSRRRV